MNYRYLDALEALGVECDHGTPVLTGVNIKKFAELIVKECADIADQESKCQDTNIGIQVAERIWHTIRNRFGVK